MPTRARSSRSESRQVLIVRVECANSCVFRKRHVKQFEAVVWQVKQSAPQISAAKQDVH